jgi:hypothetical protein
LDFDQLIIIDSSQHCTAEVTKEPHSQWTKFQHQMKTLKTKFSVWQKKQKNLKADMKTKQIVLGSPSCSLTHSLTA